LKVAVIGSSGGMGKFFAKYFASRGHEVTGADPAKSSMRDSRFKAVGSNREAVEGADVVVLATPIEKTVEAAEEVIPQMRPGTCLVELTSIKGKILGPLRRAAAAGGVELLSVHPLFGPSLSSFKGMKICVIETDGKASETRVAVLFPDAVIIPMKEREHDRMMGLMLSLTHIMNIAYAGAVDRYLPGPRTILVHPTRERVLPRVRRRPDR
jgi:prephenate dehydrogenase